MERERARHPERGAGRSRRPACATLAAALLATALCALACSEQKQPAADDAGTPATATAAAAERGRKIYENVCIACHNSDPTQAGSLGPPLAGASLALLEAKVLRGEYPPGYTPKRPSRAMPRFEYLKDRLGDVAAYLQQR